MATGWEMGFGFGMDIDVPPAAACMYVLPSGDTLQVDDVLDFSNNINVFPSSAAAAAHLLPTPPNNSTASASPHLPSGHSFDRQDPQSGGGSSSFPDDLCYIPCEEASELEWLSQFVEDSYSDIPYPTPTAGGGGGGGGGTGPSSVAGEKRSRTIVPAHHVQTHVANATWSSLAPAPSQSSSPTASSSSSTSEFFSTPHRQKSSGGRRRSGGGGSGEGRDGEARGRRCTHCASEKTPQWRTGPLGPKTLCNACGVRYKSGRLVPEYRPAASPTFVLTQHSNSHRKVTELRRQKDLLLHHDGRSSSAAAAAGDARPELLVHDYEVC